ncbi:13791_t:CDS:2, partial [Dentiscutata erythropus]
EDSSAKNIRRDVEIAEIKAEIVKLKDNNEENKELTQDISPERVDNVHNSISDQCDNATSCPRQNSHRKKGAKNIVQLIADGIKDDAQSNDKATPCDVISIESLCQNSSIDSLLSLVQLFDKADDAEYGAILSSLMTEISAGGPGQNSAEVSELIASIPFTYDSNYLGNSSFTPQIALAEAYFNDPMPSSMKKGTNEV